MPMLAPYVEPVPLPQCFKRCTGTRAGAEQIRSLPGPPSPLPTRPVVLRGLPAIPARRPVLFGRDQIIKYKKGQVASRRWGLAEFRENIREQLSSSDPPLLSNDLLDGFLTKSLGELKGRKLKHYEDILDWLLCAYLAAYLWAWSYDRSEMIGDLASGYIINPKPLTPNPAMQRTRPAAAALQVTSKSASAGRSAELYRYASMTLVLQRAREKDPEVRRLIIIEETRMTEADRIKYLRIALVVVGLTFTFGIWPLTIVWPSGWSWHPGGRSEYLEMILGIYATLGVFLMLASRDPMAHRSLIWFTVWSSVVHRAVLAVQSVANHQHIGHLWGTFWL